MLIQLLGYVGNLLFIYSAFPELVRTIKAKKALGTPLDLILTVFVGMIAMFFYTYLSKGWDLILFINYWSQAIIWGVLLYYRLFRLTPKTKTTKIKACRLCGDIDCGKFTSCPEQYPRSSWENGI